MRRGNGFAGICIAAFGLLAAGLCTGAHAAEAPPPSTKTSPAAKPAPINTAPVLADELVVTASGIGAPRATHAGNITRIEREEIGFVGADHPSELLDRAPGLNIQRGNGQEHLTAIRSPVLTAGAGAGSFLYLEDGIPLRAAGFANVNGLFEANIEQAGALEIVRGPGSALYGSNAVHGLLNVLSRAPSPRFETELTGSVGPHGLFDATATTSTTYRDDNRTHGVRASLGFAEDGGFRANSGFGQQKVQLRYDLADGSDTLRATLSGINLNQETAGFVVGPSAYRDDSLRKTNPNPEAFRDAWAARTAIRWEHEIEPGRRLALTPYARTTDMRFLMHFVPGQAVEENDHQSVGLQSAYYIDTKGGHRIVLGTDVEYTDGNLTEIQGTPTAFSFVQGTHYDYDVQAVVIAPYLHSVWQLTDATALTAGVRVEYTRYEYQNNAPDGIVGRFLRIPDRTDEFLDATPKLGLTHKFSNALIGFANLARGARAPQTTDLYRLQSKQIPGQIESEKLDSIEIGGRGTVSGLRYELAGFYMEKENFSFRDADGFNVPNGRTNHLGVEAEFYAPLPENFDLTGSATYARHTYDFNNIISPGASSTESIRSGDDVDTAPRTLANIRLGYSFLAGDGRAELEWVHVGDYFMDASNSARYPGHNIFNLRADIALTEHLSIFGRLTNITDKRYAERADFAFDTERYFPGEDRAAHIGASLRF